MKKFTVLFLAFVALFFACRKNTDDTTEREKGPIPSLNVESALLGKVLDTNGDPVANATVEVAGLSLKTNAEGLFWVKKQLLNNNGTLVRVYKPGFFEATRFAYPNLNGTTYLEVRLMAPTLVTSFDAAKGASLSIGQGAEIQIPSNAMANAFGEPFQGAVTARAVWLTPTAKETFQNMPGDLRAINAEGQAKILKTYGMVGLELTGVDGEKLNLIAGKTAKITFPVPTSIRSLAPPVIPLWYFNSDNGYWAEEGSATLTNGSYVGEVSHFSFWNCDVPANYVKLKLCFSNGSGTPISGLQVGLTIPTFGTGTGYTDNNGLVGGLVPANETFLLEVFGPCGNAIYQDNIGPFNADTDLGKITVQGIQTIAVSGKLKTCDNAVVNNGLVRLEQNNKTNLFGFTDATGDFSVAVVSCAGLSDVVLTGYNLDNSTQSTPQTVSLSGTTVEVGTVQVCTALDEYITVTCNGSTQIFTANPDFYRTNVGGGILSASGYLAPGNPDTTAAYFSYENLQSNQTTAKLLNLFFNKFENNVLRTYGCTYCVDPACTCSVTDADPIIFTKFPQNIGDYIEGSVSGDIRSFSDNNLTPFTLSFRLKRTR